MLSKQNHRVIFLHPNVESVATPISELLERFNYYGEVLQEECGSQDVRLHLVLGIRKKSFEEINFKLYKNLIIQRLSSSRIFPILFTFRVLILLGNIVRKNDRCTVVSGDLRAGLLSLISIKLCFGSAIKTQISIHGRLLPNYRFDFRQYFIRPLLWLGIKCTDSIRVVSEHLLKHVVQHYPGTQSKLFVSPIPVTNFDSSNNSSTSRLNSIAIVGRLHTERGILEALDFAKLALQEFKEVSLIIAGNGPLFRSVENWINASGLENRIKFLGHLPKHEVPRLLARVQILLSNAPHEGYGLSVREAALSGCVVVARKNMGTEELANLYGTGIFLYETKQEFMFQIRAALNESLDFAKLENLRKLQSEINFKAVNRLITSWLFN